MRWGTLLYTIRNFVNIDGAAETGRPRHVRSSCQFASVQSTQEFRRVAVKCQSQSAVVHACPVGMNHAFCVPEENMDVDA